MLETSAQGLIIFQAGFGWILVCTVALHRMLRNIRDFEHCTIMWLVMLRKGSSVLRSEQFCSSKYMVASDYVLASVIACQQTRCGMLLSPCGALCAALCILLSCNWVLVV